MSYKPTREPVHTSKSARWSGAEPSLVRGGWGCDVARDSLLTVNMARLLDLLVALLVPCSVLCAVVQVNLYIKFNNILISADTDRFNDQYN